MRNKLHGTFEENLYDFLSTVHCNNCDGFSMNFEWIWLAFSEFVCQCWLHIDTLAECHDMSVAIINQLYVLQKPTVSLPLEKCWLQKLLSVWGLFSGVLPVSCREDVYIHMCIYIYLYLYICIMMRVVLQHCLLAPDLS